MPPSEYAERIAAIRLRFASRLAAEIDETTAALPILADAVATSGQAVAVVYRRFHSMCGIAPTLGFERVGRAAQVLDSILVQPFRAERGLTADEMAKFRQDLAAFQAAAHVDIQSTDTAEYLT
jgi:hypothetical protein